MSIQEITIQMDHRFRFTGERVEFYNKCVEWGRRLNVLLNGHVSLKFSERPYLLPHVCFWWVGREIAVIVLENQGGFRAYANTPNFPGYDFAASKKHADRYGEEKTYASDKNIWEEILRPAANLVSYDDLDRQLRWDDTHLDD